MRIMEELRGFGLMGLGTVMTIWAVIVSYFIAISIGFPPDWMTAVASFAIGSTGVALVFEKWEKQLFNVRAMCLTMFMLSSLGLFLIKPIGLFAEGVKALCYTSAYWYLLVHFLHHKCGKFLRSEISRLFSSLRSKFA